MYRFGYPSYQPKVNFEQLFEKECLSAQDILSLDQVLNEVRVNLDLLSKLLPCRPKLVEQLVHYAINPSALLTPPCYSQLSSQYPFLSFQILSMLGQTLFDFYSKTDKQEHHSEENSTIPLLCMMFSALSNNQDTYETATGYLSRFIQSLQYQRPTELFRYFLKYPVSLTTLVDHFDSRSMMQIFSYLLAVDDEAFNQTKQLYVQKLVKSVVSEPRTQQLVEKLYNLGLLIDEISEKSEERYDGARFVLLADYFITTPNAQLLSNIIFKQALSSKDQDASQELIVSAVEVLLSFIKHHQNIKNKQQKRLQASGGFYSSNSRLSGNSRDEDSIQEDINIGMDEDLINVYSSIGSKCLELPLLQLPKMAKLKVFSLLRAITTIHKECARVIFNNQWPTFTRSIGIPLFQMHSNNNMLHNCLKSLYITAIEVGFVHELCAPDSGLVEFIINSYAEINSNENTPLIIKTADSSTQMEVQEEKQVINEVLSKPKPREASYINQLYGLAEAIHKASNKDSILSETLESQYPAWKPFLRNHFQPRQKVREHNMGGQNPHDKAQLSLVFARPPEGVITSSIGEQNKSESVFFRLGWGDKNQTPTSKVQINGVQEQIDIDMESEQKTSSSSSSSSDGSSDDGVDEMLETGRRRHRTSGDHFQLLIREEEQQQNLEEQQEVKIQEQICIEEDLEDLSC